MAAALTLSACGSDDGADEGTDNGDAPAATSDVKVGMAYDVGGRGDQSFNDSAAAGLDQAVEEFGMEAQESEAEDGEAESAREERLRTFADAGYDPIIAVGFAYAASIAKVSEEYPDVNFAIIDDSSVEADNVASLVFAEEQGSFLVGAAAALKTETDQIGFVGGVETPLIQKFEAGYVAGAEAVNPDIEVDVTYLTQVPDFSGFADPAKGKTAAQGMFDNGADIVYHAAGGSGGGVFEAASESDNLAIGVDSDQYNTADPSVQDVILTSMLKNVNVAVYEYLSDVEAGDVPSGVTTYDLAVDGVGYSTSGGFVDDIVDQLDEFKQQIIDGEITVPTAP
ncbi:MAG: BMP family ABC transporter substrate-binding protein [Actinobacteria bacterium]|jgi:basic membrane protein A|nr:BMP family ABC transporter substrate-binding protein [Actinomycetota bacterium]